MANPRQRRKNRSSSTLKPSLNAKRQMKKRLARAPTVHGADVLKDNYDPKLTLRQNYARLGLVPSLDVRPDTGGVERLASTSTGASDQDSDKLRKGMARVVRDEHGNIVEIIEPEEDAGDQANAQTVWGKPLESVADQEVDDYMPKQLAHKKENKVLTHLEQLAAKAAPVDRHTSSLEAQWLADLVAKYDNDTEAMARDIKLNPWQKTAGEIKRAIKKAGGFEAFRS